MANQIRKLYQDLQAQSFDMRALLRLATWGGAAAAALLVAVVSAYSTAGSRTAVALAAPGDQRITAQLAARSAEVETESRRLSEAVLALTADRDRLLTRIASLERSLEDVTGSIKRQAVTPPPSPPAQSLPAIAFAPAPLAGPPRQGQLPKEAPKEVPKDAEPATPPAPGEPQPVAHIPANTPPAAAADDDQAKGEFAVDLGGSANFDGMRSLWNSSRNANAALFKGLHPLVTVRENKSRGVELRLIVGPLASTEQATRMCATLLAARRSCQMTTYEGRPLPRSAPPDPERQSERKTERPPAVTTPARNSGSSSPRSTRP